MRRFCALLGAIPTCAVLGAILAAGVCLPAGDADAKSREAVAKDARLAGDRARTRFIADLSKKVECQRLLARRSLPRHRRSA